MFGKKNKVETVTTEEIRDITLTADPPVFIEFEGATGTIDEETNTLKFTPRGPIWIQLDNIGAYYDHTILMFGNKIRVMETAAQIAVKIMEAMK